MANLLQISSAFGRAMETVDRRAMTAAVYPILLERSPPECAACRRERHRRDRRGLSVPDEPRSRPAARRLDSALQADVLRRALDESWTIEQLTAELDALDRRRDTGALGS